METQADILKQGWQFHQQGDHARAEELYRRALSASPGHPAVLYCLGRLALDVLQVNVAADLLGRAASIDPSQPIIHADLAQAQQSLGRFDDAVASYRRAIELDPNRADVHVNLGNTLLQSGQASEAIASYHRALECDENLADAHSCLGAALEQTGEIVQAEQCYRRAIELRPNYAQAQFNLGTLLIRLARPAEALASLERAVELVPNCAPFEHNLGVALNLLGRPAEAQKRFETAVSLDPSQSKYHFNLGEVLEQQGRIEDAVREYDQSLQNNPQYAQARCTRGTALLKLGQFHAGWRDYESRVGLPQYDTLTFSQPLWDGSPLGNRTLLVHCEQGLGDTLQFIRYVKLAEQRAGRLIVAARPELIPLLRCSGYPNLVSRNEPLPAFEVHAPLLSLPRIFDTEVDRVPADVPYLAADQSLIESWRSRLDVDRAFKIGIHWQGNPVYCHDRSRSIPLTYFARLAEVPGVKLYALQKIDGRDQIGSDPAFPVHDLGPELDNNSGAFMDTAAVIGSLDLVVSSDTSVAHLAGGLGARVWVALGNPSEWRWLLAREDSPWYPTMRLFRQASPGDWTDVFERMAAELIKLVPSANQRG